MAGTPDNSLTFHDIPWTMDAALDVLSPPVRSWFVQHFGSPTAIQRLAWPLIGERRNALLAAPTGSGKTLAAVLPLLDRLLREPCWGGPRVLYIAPLKALANDMHRNLLGHLDGLRGLLPQGHTPPTVGLRTGDTSPEERRQLELDPPAMLLTTPETLAILLARPSAREQFSDVRHVVIDEIHALAPTKRGADLAVSLQRVAAITGETVQRIGISATCRPLDEVARFLVGVGQPAAVATVADESPLDLRVEPLFVAAGEADALPPGLGFMARLTARLAPVLESQRSTLIFTNTRALAERLGWALRRRFPSWSDAIAVHHSALAPDRRRAVERAFKQGRLRAVVCTTSLELGLDIGSVDGVVLVHPPGGVVRTLQRLGRSGHAPGRRRSGLILTATPAELLEAAVTAAAARAGQLERLRIADQPLDVLCQQLLGMAAAGPWQPEEAYELVRASRPFRRLSREDFDACVAYLLGRGAAEGEWLPPRLRNTADGMVLRDRATRRVVLRNLGTILTEESCPVQVQPPPSGDAAPPVAERIGEVEDAFADRLRPGDRFLLDGRCLEFRRRESAAVVVEEVAGRPVVPRWVGDGWQLDEELSRRLYCLRVRAGEALRDGDEALARLLRAEYQLDAASSAVLADYFQLQEAVSEIPGESTLLVEMVAHDEAAVAYFHTPLSRAGNDALARVAVRRLSARGDPILTSQVADLGFGLFFARDPAWNADQVRELLSADGFDADLAVALQDSETLRQRFRRVALTGLMLLRNPLGGRRRVGGHDWAERRLFEQVRAGAPDFVLLRQAAREVCAEACDGPSGRAYAEALQRRTVRVRSLWHESPFATAWTQESIGPSPDVENPVDALRRLHARLTGTGGSDASE